MTSSTYTLPESFLDGPAPNLRKSKIDFESARIPEYKPFWAVVLDEVLTEEECDQLVAAAEATTNGQWERAMVNVGMGKQMMLEDARKCGRIIWDSPQIMAKLWARIEAAVPEIHRLENCPHVTGSGPMKRGEVWKVTRLNERQRFLKYIGGEFFKEHCDGTYETPDKKERSYYTLQLYLNNPEGKDGEEPLVGGATTFHSMSASGENLNIEPRAGRVLLFQHRNLLHSGADVISGKKLAMRTDIMFEKEKATASV